MESSGSVDLCGFVYRKLDLGALKSGDVEFNFTSWLASAQLRRVKSSSIKGSRMRSTATPIGMLLATTMVAAIR